MKNNHQLGTLKLFIFHYHAANTIIISFLPLYLKYKGLSGIEIGWVLAIGPFASIISQPFWGYLSDKYQTIKRMLILSIIGMLIMSIIFFQMNTLTTILIFGAFFYFFSSPVGGLSDSLAQRRALDLRVPFGSIRTWGSIGFAFSSLVVGEILTQFGIQYIVWPYVILGSILLIIAFKVTDVNTEGTPITLKDLSTIAKNTPFILFLLLMMLITITHRANDSFVSIFVTELGGTEGLAGTAWFIALISEATVFATAGFWFRKYQPVTFVIIAGIIYTFRWFIYGMTSNPYMIVFLQLTHGISFAVFYVAAIDYVTKIIPSRLHSSGHLIFYSVMFGLSGIFGSLGGGAMMEHFGLPSLYFIMGVMTSLGVIFLTLYTSWLKNRTKHLNLKQKGRAT